MRQARQCGPAQGHEGTGLTEQWVARRRAGQSHQGGVEDEIAQQQGHLAGNVLGDLKGQQPTRTCPQTAAPPWAPAEP